MGKKIINLCDTEGYCTADNNDCLCEFYQRTSYGTCGGYSWQGLCTNKEALENARSKFKVQRSTFKVVTIVQEKK